MKLLLVILVGVVAGLIGALCGVGGGVVIVPALVKGLGFDQKNAVATSMAIIIIIAISATVNNQRAAGSLIDWRIVLVVGSRRRAGRVVRQHLDAGAVQPNAHPPVRHRTAGHRRSDVVEAVERLRLRPKTARHKTQDARRRTWPNERKVTNSRIQ
jgi:ribosomal protein L35AE/L33A